MSTPSTPTIGVISDATLAQTFRELGFRVITGASFRESATAISGELKSGLSFPVVIAETDDAGVGPWVSSTAGKTSVIVIPSDGPTLDTGSAKRLEAPATVNDLLPLLGYQGAPEPFGSIPIGRPAPTEQTLFPVAPEPLPLPAPQVPAPPSVMSVPVELPPPADLDVSASMPEVSRVEPSAPSALFPQPEPAASTPATPAFVDPTGLFPRPAATAEPVEPAVIEIDEAAASDAPEPPTASVPPAQSSPSALFPGLFPATAPVESAIAGEAMVQPVVVEEASTEPVRFAEIVEPASVTEEADDVDDGEGTVLDVPREEHLVASEAFIPIAIDTIADVAIDTEDDAPAREPGAVDLDAQVREPILVDRLLDPQSVPLEPSQAERDAALTVTHPHPNVSDLFSPARPVGAHAPAESPVNEPVMEEPSHAPSPFTPEPLTIEPAPVLDVVASVEPETAPLSPADLLGVPVAPSAPVEELPFAPLVAPVGERIPQPAAPAPLPTVVPLPVPHPAPAPVAADVPVPVEVDEPDLFEQRAIRTPQPIVTHAPTRTVGHRGEVVFFGAGKGGVGKSTQTLLTAHTAAKAGLRVTVVDANRGQADIRTMLRLNKAPLPTIYDAVRTGNPADAFLRPDQYNQYRPHGLEALSFALVQGPPPSLADPSVVTAEVYAQVIEYARQHSDLVVVDTQIAEAYLSDIFEGVVIPNLLSGGWWVAIVNESRAGVDNLTERLIEFETRGVTNARNLIMASRYSDFDEATQRSIERKYAQFGTFIGSAADDPNIADQMNLGNIFIESRATVDTTRALLLRVTGNQAFNPVASHTGKRRGWFRR